MINFRTLKVKGFKSFVEPTEILIENGISKDSNTVFHNRSIAENVSFYKDEKLFSGIIKIENGLLITQGINVKRRVLGKICSFDKQSF